MVKMQGQTAIYRQIHVFQCFHLAVRSLTFIMQEIVMVQILNWTYLLKHLITCQDHYISP